MDIYHIPYSATISVAMCILYIYIVSRITVLISFSVSLALYNRHARKEECASSIPICIFSRNYSIRFFLFFSHQPFPLRHRHIAIATPSRASRYRDISHLFSPLVHVKSTHARTLVQAHCPSPSNPLLSRRYLWKHGESFYRNNQRKIPKSAY